MDRPSPYSQGLASRLLAHEAGSKQTPEAVAEAGQRIFQKLYLQMARLFGQAGFAAVSARALHLAQLDFPFLGGVAIEIKEEACLTRLRESLLGKPSAVASDAVAAFFANLIWLLMTLIGQDLTLRLLRDTWPGVLPQEGHAGEKEEEE